MSHHKQISGKIHVGFREYLVACGNCTSQFVDYHDTIKQFISALRSTNDWELIHGDWFCGNCAYSIRAQEASNHY